MTRRGEAGRLARPGARHGPGVEPMDCRDVPPPRAGRGAVPGKLDLAPSVLSDAPGAAGAADGQASLLLEGVPGRGRPPLAPWGHRGEGKAGVLNLVDWGCRGGRCLLGGWVGDTPLRGPPGRRFPRLQKSADIKLKDRARLALLGRGGGSLDVLVRLDPWLGVVVSIPSVALLANC